MCGRFTQAYTWSELVALYELATPSPKLEPHYNIAPTDKIDVIVPIDGGRQLTRMRWGLIPRRWKKSVKYLPSSFNARVETVVAKPMFRDAYKRNRCVIPASG
jgi:putative SOS response-associated peptidase YedK